MTYVENIFVMLAAPLIACLFVVEGHPRTSVAAIVSGMLACLLSSYVSSFFAQLTGANAVEATVEVAPVMEEIIKLLPLLYYLLVFEPSPQAVNLFAVFVAVGFVTMESACYLAEYGTSSPVMLAMRGISASMMHLSCGAAVGFGVTNVWEHPWLKAAGTFGLLSIAIVYHGAFNLLAVWEGPAQLFAFVLPLVVLVLVQQARRRLTRLLRSSHGRPRTAPRHVTD